MILTVPFLFIAFEHLFRTRIMLFYDMVIAVVHLAYSSYERVRSMSAITHSGHRSSLPHTPECKAHFFKFLLITALSQQCKGSFTGVQRKYKIDIAGNFHNCAFIKQEGLLVEIRPPAFQHVGVGSLYGEVNKFEHVRCSLHGGKRKGPKLRLGVPM